MNREEAQKILSEWAEAIQGMAGKRTDFSELLERTHRIKPDDDPRKVLGEVSFERLERFLAATSFERGEPHYETWIGPRSCAAPDVGPLGHARCSPKTVSGRCRGSPAAEFQGRHRPADTRGPHGMRQNRDRNGDHPWLATARGAGLFRVRPANPSPADFRAHGTEPESGTGY